MTIYNQRTIQFVENRWKEVKLTIMTTKNTSGADVAYFTAERE